MKKGLFKKLLMVGMMTLTAFIPVADVALIQPTGVQAQTQTERLTLPLGENFPVALDHFEQLLQYIDAFEQNDQILTADILAQVDAPIPVNVYTEENTSALLSGEELWEYTYTESDDMTAEEINQSVALFFFGNNLISTILTSQIPLVDDQLISEEGMQELLNTGALTSLVEAAPPIYLQGFLKYQGAPIRHVVVPTEDQQYYLIYLDEELFDVYTMPHDDVALISDQMIESINQVALALNELDAE